MKTTKEKAPHLTLQETREQKTTAHLTPAEFTQERKKLIEGVRILSMAWYAKDPEIQLGVAGLLTQLRMAKVNKLSIEFVEGMCGFMLWAADTKQDPHKVLTTLIHDLGEFARNRDENWFCPRTCGYVKYFKR